jgi:hypothetical protein
MKNENGIELFILCTICITFVWRAASRMVPLDEAMQRIRENIELPVFDRLVF